MQYTLIAYNDFEKKEVAYTIIFDAVTSASESYSNTITTFVVEDGGMITDHIIKTKDKITIEGVVTDLSFNQGDDGLVMFLPDGSLQATLTESWSKKTKEALLDINDKMLPCSLKISNRSAGQEYIEADFFPCLIESLNLDRSGGQYGFIQPKIVLVPVRIAKLQFEKVTAAMEVVPLLKQQNNNASIAKTTSGSTSDSDGSSSEADKVPLDLEKTGDIEKKAGMISGLVEKGKQVVGGVGAWVDKALPAQYQRRDEAKAELKRVIN